MLRKDREITDKTEIESIIEKGIICRIALFDDDYPYIVPVNYGYKDGVLYIHSSKRGKKLDLIRRNNSVCFEIDIDAVIVNTNKPNEATTKYKSVIGYGKAYIIVDDGEKKIALDHLMRHYTDKSEGYEYRYDKCFPSVCVLKIVIDKMSGKQSL